MSETMKSAETQLANDRPALLDDLTANPSIGALCLAIMTQTALRAYRLGRKIQGVRFSQLNTNGDKVTFTANYSPIEGLSFFPGQNQSDMVRYFGAKNAGIAEALRVNPEYSKLFENIIEAVKSFSRAKGKAYTSCYVDDGRMTLDDVFMFSIKAGVQE